MHIFFCLNASIFVALDIIDILCLVHSNFSTNKLSLKHQTYPKSWKLSIRKKCNVRDLLIASLSRDSYIYTTQKIYTEKKLTGGGLDHLNVLLHHTT